MIHTTFAKQQLLLLICLLGFLAVNGQIGIGTNSPNAKSLLDLSSTDKGLLVPRMTAAQRLAINPAAPARGLLLFDTDSTAFMYWTGSSWQRLSAGSANTSSGWQLNGNALTGTEKIGSTNAVEVQLISNNQTSIRIEPAGNGVQYMPNISMGASGNYINSGFGNTIAGGGFSGTVFNAIEFGEHNFIGSGSENRIDNHKAGAIVSGKQNAIFTSSDRAYSFIGSGYRQYISNQRAFIGSGEYDTVTANYGTVLNGSFNKVSGSDFSSILNGNRNRTSSVCNFIGSGYDNSTTASFGTIVNGDKNQASGSHSFIATGQRNVAAGFHSFIGVGFDNRVSTASTNGTRASIINGSRNLLAANYGFIGGGDTNTIATGADYASVLNGSENSIGINGLYGIIGGGTNNTVDGNHAIVLGGNTNEANADYATVLGGAGNLAGGNYSTVLGGLNNSIFSEYAIAGGFKTETVHNGTFLFADYRANATFFRSKADGQFLIRSANGALFTAEDSSTVIRAQIHARSAGVQPQIMADQVNDDFARIRFRSFNSNTNHWDVAAKVSAAEFNVFRNGTGNVLQLTPASATNLMLMSNGARLTAGGAWTNASDRAVKDNIVAANEWDILEKLASLPISTWHYKNEATGVLHIGPMAQDFKAAFGLGEGDKSIATVDADGVNMAAIQALYKRLLLLEKQNETLQQEIKELKQGKK